MSQSFTTPISRHLWETRYRYGNSGIGDVSVDDTWARVAEALASVETRDRARWCERFHALLEGFKFLPGGRILAGAGTSHRVTLFNCFVMGTIPDSLPGILDALKEGALTMQQGGGVGYDFSTLRPQGSDAPGTGTIASGPVSFMRIWDSTCATLLSTGARRGAMMGTLRCDHPDIETFVDAKRDRGELRHFNVSVLVSDAFMAAVEENGDWPDDRSEAFPSWRHGALTMQQGGGVGYDFSTLRPQGSDAPGTGTIASGPVSFMRIWDSTCATLLSTGARRGAMMGTLRCDHPDIETFVDAKRDRGELRHFNVSVLVSDAFMAAVEENGDWPLVFPASTPGSADASDGEQTVMREWPGVAAPILCRVYRVVRARELWERIMRAAYDCAEPGVLFIDRINANNNLAWRERISATNPCGEIPLPPYGACDLGAMNLTCFVRDAFMRTAHMDMAALEEAVTMAVRMLDNVIDASSFPLPAQAQQARGSRRIGLGLTGLADALVMLGLRYDSEAGRSLAAEAMRVICHGAYRASVAIAAEKGCFPFFDEQHYMKSPFVAALPAELQKAIRDGGMRNSHLTAVQPRRDFSCSAAGEQHLQRHRADIRRPLSTRGAGHKRWDSAVPG